MSKDVRPTLQTHTVDIVYNPGMSKGVYDEWHYVTTCNHFVWRTTNNGSVLIVDGLMNFDSDEIISLKLDGMEIVPPDPEGSKEVPRKRKDKGGWWKCMRCGHTLTYFDENGCSYDFNYCPTCGQRIKK